MRRPTVEASALAPAFQPLVAPPVRPARPTRPIRRPEPAAPLHALQEPVVAPALDAAGSDPGRGDLSAIARGGALSLIGGATLAIFGFVLAVVISHGLGATGAGAFFEAVALFTIAMRVAQIGADVGVVRALPQAIALGRHADTRSILTAALVPVAVASVVLGVVFFAFAPELAGVVVRGTPPDALVSFLRIWAPFLVLGALTAVMLAAIRGLGSLKPFVLIENVGKPVLQPVFALAVLALGLGTAAIALSWAVPIALGCLAAAWWLTLRLRRVEDKSPTFTPRPMRALSSEFWRFSSPRAVAAFFQVTVSWVDILLVGALASATAAGIYGAASRLALLGVVVLRALILVLGPQISALLAQNLRERAQVVYQTSTWWLTALSWPLYILLAVFAPLGLGVFGHAFTQGETALIVLTAGMLVSMACGPVSVVLLMGGKSSWNLFNTIFAAGLTVGLDFALIPRYGFLGAAIATAVGTAANNIIPLVQVWALLRLHPLGTGFFVVAGGSLATYGLFGALARAFLGATPLALGIAVVAATLVYLPILRHYRDTLQLSVVRDVLRSRRALPEPARTAAAA